jgi:hypothetical protein
METRIDETRQHLSTPDLRRGHRAAGWFFTSVLVLGEEPCCSTRSPGLFLFVRSAVSRLIAPEAGCAGSPSATMRPTSAAR